MTAQRLNGKTAIVTGGARGIGAAIVSRFVAEGASVCVLDRNAGAPPPNVVVMDADVADLNAHPKLVAKVIERFARLDILVNNAGMQIRRSFLDASPADWDRVFDVNLKGAYFLAQRAAQHMEPGACMINISSIHDVRPPRGNSMYAISKAGVQMMTRCLALELSEKGIRVNAIAPGAIATDINRDVLSDDQFRERLEQRIPSKRIGVPDDISGAAVFLASEDSGYMTGATLYIDGGLLLN